ncbi:MAG: FAD-dependent monooxygenase, partial [Streptosporangiaceae bacterium]
MLRPLRAPKNVNKYIWLGTDKVFDAFTWPFVQTSSGWLWANAYGIDARSSSFVVECSAQTWAGLGFDTMNPDDTLALLENIFERHLDGHHLVRQVRDGSKVSWLNFRNVTNRHWYDGKTVLMGDAAHTTHFSIGFGTRLAIDDAIALAGKLQHQGDVQLALGAYERERQAAIMQAQSDGHLAPCGSKTSLGTSTSGQISSIPSSVTAGRRCFHGFPRSFSAGCSKCRTKVPPCASSANTRGRWPWPSTAGARWPGDGYPAPRGPDPKRTGPGAHGQAERLSP